MPICHHSLSRFELRDLLASAHSKHMSTSGCPAHATVLVCPPTHAAAPYRCSTLTSVPRLPHPAPHVYTVPIRLALPCTCTQLCSPLLPLTPSSPHGARPRSLDEDKHALSAEPQAHCAPHMLVLSSSRPFPSAWAMPPWLSERTSKTRNTYNIKHLNAT
jgi:hypothetical protein